jgi:hypothetical protein
MSRIPQKKIRNLIEHHCQDKNSAKFTQLQATAPKGHDFSGYHMLESSYLIKEDPETVWKAYQNTSPAKSWNGRMVSFGLLISNQKNTVLYRNDPYFTGIDTGQIFYVNLKIMKGLYNLAVGLEIIELDSINKSIRFSYLKGGKSSGEQMIYFIPTRKGFTEIIHTTAFKSDSYLRDRFLYPYFHQIAISEFHKNMKYFCQLYEGTGSKIRANKKI